MQSKPQTRKEPVRLPTSHAELVEQQSKYGKDDGGLTPQEFLADIARTGIIDGNYVVPILLRIQCAARAAPYFASKHRPR